MINDASTAESTRWPSAADAARLHFVSGKGGTGKTTVAAALAIAFASKGEKVLLVECEGRQAIAQLFDVPPLLVRRHAHAITRAFKRYRLFGFTGTPIFTANARSGGNPIL